MSYSLPSKWSIESLLDYTVGVIAGLQAISDLAQLAEPWLAWRENLRRSRDARDEDRWAVIGASAKVAALDATWDDSVRDLSGRAFLHSGKDASQPPYSDLFGSITAEDATDLGPAKAVVFGSMLKAKLTELAVPELQLSADTLAQANTNLGTAAEARTTAMEQSSVHELRRQKLLQQTELMAATTELGMLSLGYRNKTLIRAILAPQRSKKRREDPEAPAEDQD